MNKELAYRCQMLPAKIRDSRVFAVTALLRTGWPQEVIDRDIDSALAWARSHCLTQSQKKTRRTRAAKKTRLRGDDALDAMFASVGADPASIRRRGV